MNTEQTGQASKIDPLLEWAVFVHLDRKTDLELILLKGHLLLETILETVLERNEMINLDVNLSRDFHHLFHCVCTTIVPTCFVFRLN